LQRGFLLQRFGLSAWVSASSLGSHYRPEAQKISSSVESLPMSRLPMTNDFDVSSQRHVSNPFPLVTPGAVKRAGHFGIQREGEPSGTGHSASTEVRSLYDGTHSVSSELEHAAKLHDSPTPTARTLATKRRRSTCSIVVGGAS